MISRKNLEPPNGRWGWIVVFGAQIINIFNQALISVFGLMFGTFFLQLNESKARIALVMNLSSVFLNLSGLVTGPVLKTFSPRQVAICGCLLTSFGLILSSLTSSLVQIIFTYSFMVGIGLGLTGPAIFVAVNSYFTTKRQRAISLAMAGTGFGQMILPQIVGFLLIQYGFKGTVLIMGSLSLQGVIGAALFHPVNWHMKQKNIYHEVLTETTPLILSKRVSIESIFEMPEYSEPSFWKRLSHLMDLSLLKDLRFLILNFGLGAGYAVSIDFALILPFFLQENAFLDKSQTAICMSILAAADLLSRLTFHFFTDKLELTSRVTFMVGVMILGVVRSILAELTTYTSVLIACAFFGYFRALTVVNQVLSVSEYCAKWCPEKLPGALGLNMIIKGISVLSMGEMLGIIRDITQSYAVSLHAQNILLTVVMVVWLVELAWYKRP